MRSSFTLKQRRSKGRLGAVLLLALVLALAAVAPPSGQAADVAPAGVGVAAVNTYSNTGPIQGPQQIGKFSPYPSEITVPTLTGNISGITVTLRGVSHPRPDDFDVLLVGPTGASILLMSDACGGERITSIDLTFADGAPALPDTTTTVSGPCVSGTYMPTNYGSGDTFDGGHSPTATTLAGAFLNTNPEGTWSLYIMDDRTGWIGSIGGGWSITITTNAPPTITPISDVTMTVGETRTVQVTATDPDEDPLTYGVSSSLPGVATAAIDDEGVIDLDAIAPGTTVITVSVSDGVNDPVTVTFNVTVNPPATEEPTEEPTQEPTEEPTQEPTEEPTQEPTEEPTVEPTEEPTQEPTEEPTAEPTEEPTQEPTQEPTVEPTAEPTEEVVVYTAAQIAAAQAPLCADLSGQTNPIIRASVPADAVTNGNVYCRVLAEDGVFPNPIDSARIGDPGLITYGVIHAVDVFGVTADGLAYPAFNHTVTVCLQGTGRFIYLSALNSPRTTYEPPSFMQDGYTCATIPAAGTVVLIPPAPMN